jgi:hypothetical protein
MRRLGNPFLQIMRASFQFHYANHLARTTGSPARKTITELLGDARDDVRYAIQDGDYKKYAASLLGPTLEDLAWFSDPPDVATFDDALAASKIAAGQSGSAGLQARVDEGRALYRSAVYGPEGGRDDRLGKAEVVLRNAAMTQDPDGSLVKPLLEARFHLAKTYLARRKYDDAAAQLKMIGTAQAPIRYAATVATAAAYWVLIRTQYAPDKAEAEAAKNALDAILKSAGESGADLRYLQGYASGLIAAADNKFQAADEAFVNGIRAAREAATRAGPALTEYLYFDLLLRRVELQLDSRATGELSNPISKAGFERVLQDLSEYLQTYPWYVESALRDRFTAAKTKVNGLR